VVNITTSTSAGHRGRNLQPVEYVGKGGQRPERETLLWTVVCEVGINARRRNEVRLVDYPSFLEIAERSLMRGKTDGNPFHT
jgi:hypothetical protein